MSTITHDNTSFVSVQVDAIVDCRVMMPQEVDSARAEFAQRSASVGLVSEIEYRVEEFAPSLRKIRASHPEIASWIDFQHKTITLLAAQLENHRGTLTGIGTQSIKISAAGMECASATLCKTSDFLEVVLSLGQTMPTILILGQVKEVTKNTSDGAENKLRVEFKHIRESDQEMLMRHIHRVQLNQIRSARANRQKVVITTNE